MIILLRNSNGDPNRETDEICALNRKPLVSKYASSRGEQISSRGRMKWTFNKKNAHLSRCGTTKTCGAFWLSTSHFKKIIIVKRTLSI